MTTNDEMDAAFRAERHAWAVARRALPGQVGHDPGAWQEWEKCAHAADALSSAREGSSPASPAAVRELPREHTDTHFPALLQEMHAAICEAYEALDALASDNLPARQATGAALRRSLDMMRDLMGQAEEHLQANDQSRS